MTGWQRHEHAAGSGDSLLRAQRGERSARLARRAGTKRRRPPRAAAGQSWLGSQRRTGEVEELVSVGENGVVGAGGDGEGQGPVARSGARVLLGSSRGSRRRRGSASSCGTAACSQAAPQEPRGWRGERTCRRRGDSGRGRCWGPFTSQVKPGPRRARRPGLVAGLAGGGHDWARRAARHRCLLVSASWATMTHAADPAHGRWRPRGSARSRPSTPCRLAWTWTVDPRRVAVPVGLVILKRGRIVGRAGGDSVMVR